MTQIFDRLPDVTDSQRAAIFSAARTSEAHAQLMRDIPAMTGLEVGGSGPDTPLAGRFSIAAWNVERCLDPEESAALLQRHDVKVALLSEMDSGMARTGQRNTVAAMAEVMGMHYAFGVEFYEMGLGGPTERHFCKDDFNARGWHGNGVLSAAPFERLALIRLDRDGHWFTGAAGQTDQPRVGGRMAVAAVLPTEAGPVCVVSTHLESNAQAPHRHAELARLLTEVEAFAGEMPVLIGGDLNTGNHMPPDYDWRQETLFALAEERGYAWSLTPDGTTTRKSLITPHPTRKMKLDWFCHRGLTGAGGQIVPALTPDDTPLSDHECLVGQVTVPASRCA
ncbi:endonuclease/exonuclease/phosphatase family protein [uncultured Roseobacter sp.]|uniref:endonuclease/exonuclease/phosphatase family protein n=1 Tax=uncultured Roseobacter sp. TaxID=114847 RepID=UPI002602ABD6|nr:endonuclease/exonuclease/phosphatase family protein [uncultured Roseobacter sp.]